MNNIIAKLHVAKKQLGLDEDTYRAALETATGKRSVKEMNEAERLAALRHFEARGFKGLTRRPGGQRLITGKYAGKLQALWIAGWNLGLVRNKDDAALAAFIKRQTGVDHTRFLHHAEDAARAIEALKGWLARDGGVDWHLGETMPHHVRLSGLKIATAQHAYIAKAGPSTQALHEMVLRITGHPPVHLVSEGTWIPVMNSLGQWLRALKKTAADSPSPPSSKAVSPTEGGDSEPGAERARPSDLPSVGETDAAGVREGESAQVLFFTGVKREQQP